MKFALVILAVVAAASAQFNNGAYPGYNGAYPGYNGAYQGYNQGRYNPYNSNIYNRNRYPNYQQFASPTFAPSTYSTPAPFAYSTPAAPVYSTPVPIVAKYNNIDARSANIVRQENEINPDGSYRYAFETENGIAAQEQGALKAVSGTEAAEVVQGSYSYTSPEGVPVSISYVADENGFRAVGDAIPVAPEIPEAIVRSLAFIAANPPKPELQK